MKIHSWIPKFFFVKWKKEQVSICSCFFIVMLIQLPMLIQQPGFFDILKMCSLNGFFSGFFCLNISYYCFRSTANYQVWKQTTYVSLLQTKILNRGWYMTRKHSQEKNVKEAVVHVKISTERLKRWKILCCVSMEKHTLCAIRLVENIQRPQDALSLIRN